MLKILAFLILGIPALLILVHTLIRIIRYFYKFPIPHFLANAIDNPLRRRIQPHSEIPVRLGILPGMTVLEVGPGNGSYTMAAARRLGEAGRIITVDIEPRMIERVQRAIAEEGLANVEARVADVYELPFDDAYFDLVYMIAVIGEIPSPRRAMEEFYRVLKPAGSLAFSELLFDPDYPLPRTLVRIATQTGFVEECKGGNLLSYTLVLRKPEDTV